MKRKILKFNNNKTKGFKKEQNIVKLAFHSIYFLCLKYRFNSRFA